MDNSLVRPDLGERHFSGQKVHEPINFYGVLKGDDATAVDGAVALVFHCDAGGHERSLGYTFTNREGSYSIYVPKPPDQHDLPGLIAREGKEQPEETHDHKPLKKASVNIKSISMNVYQDQTCIMSEGFARSDSHQEESCKELRQSIVQSERDHSREESVPGQEKNLKQEHEPLQKASVKVNHISVNVIQDPIHKMSKRFVHPGSCRGVLNKPLREDRVQGECSAEKCMPGQEETLVEETIAAQAGHHRAEPQSENAVENQHRQPDLSSYGIKCEPKILLKKGPDRVAGSHAQEKIASIQEGADHIKSLMTSLSSAQSKKILTGIGIFLVGLALFNSPPLRDIGLLKDMVRMKMRNIMANKN